MLAEMHNALQASFFMNKKADLHTAWCMITTRPSWAAAIAGCKTKSPIQPAPCKHNRHAN
jgi:hypothetical protein